MAFKACDLQCVSITLLHKVMARICCKIYADCSQEWSATVWTENYI